MEDSDPDRLMSAGWRARAHHAKEKVKRVWKHPSPIPALQQSFFPRPLLSTQSTVASLAISGSQSTVMPISTFMTTSTSTSLFTIGTPSTLASETVVGDLGSLLDVWPLKAAYKTAADGARGIIEKKRSTTLSRTLADVQDRDIFLHLVTEVLRVLNDNPLLSGITLQGLAVILDLFPDDIDLGSLQGAFVDMLASLQDRLRAIRTVNNDLQMVPLLSALNALLDAVVRRGVSGLDREAIYNDLRALLAGLASHPNVMACFQALYAKQVLAIIGNDESLPMSVSRRGKLAFVLAGNVSSMATKFDLASTESAYQNFKEIFDFSIQDRWHQSLIYVDYLWQLEDFVLHSRFQSDICFQLGVVLRLEQIAVAQKDVAVRNSAIKFLTALRETPIPLVPEMAKNTLRRLERLERSTGDTKHDVAIPKPYQDDLRPVWDPAWLAAPKGILFKAVRDTDHRHATIDNIPAHLDTLKQTVEFHHSEIAQPSLEDVHSPLKIYYERGLASASNRTE
ncbi:hypothetical protein BGX27_002226 [Mortierella sp. AM989]|nr:hypothetical protein BGX27_002226 [Mortierella sp. AM989]